MKEAGNLRSHSREKLKPQIFRSLANRAGERNGEATHVMNTSRPGRGHAAVRLFCPVLSMTANIAI